MIRKALDNELNRLYRDLALLGGRVEEIIQDTTTVLREHDLAQARRIFREDSEIRLEQNHLEQQCVNLIALQAPLATDLRIVTACLKLVTDVERVADQCSDICEILLTYPDLHRLPTPPRILQMLNRACEMFSRAMASFQTRGLSEEQLAEAREVIRKDDEVDRLFTETIMELSQVLASDQRLISQCTDYMFVAKYVERIADHAVNIAEWTVYARTGQHRDMSDKLVGRKAILQEPSPLQHGDSLDGSPAPSVQP